MHNLRVSLPLEDRRQTVVVEHAEALCRDAHASDGEVVAHLQRFEYRARHHHCDVSFLYAVFLQIYYCAHVAALHYAHAEVLQQERRIIIVDEQAKQSDRVHHDGEVFVKGDVVEQRLVNVLDALKHHVHGEFLGSFHVCKDNYNGSFCSIFLL